jgi:lysyl-tRNA synthetase class 2
MAYADYNDLMDITEDLLSKMVMELTGSYVLNYHPDHDNMEKVLKIDFTRPWRRMCMLE